MLELTPVIVPLKPFTAQVQAILTLLNDVCSLAEALKIGHRCCLSALREKRQQCPHLPQMPFVLLLRGCLQSLQVLLHTCELMFQGIPVPLEPFLFLGRSGEPSRPGATTTTAAGAPHRMPHRPGTRLHLTTHLFSPPFFQYFRSYLNISEKI